MSEEKLVQYCSPTLAGIKTGSLFSCKYENGNIMREYFRSYNRRLRSKGIRLLPLQYRDGRALVYVYRPSMLSSDLNNAEACEILRSLGYSTEMPERCITHLIKRLSECKEFPHEIGLFLGYPPEDVRGFILNKAVGYKCVGCWKVYGNAEKANILFDKYRKCTDIYTEQLALGKSIEGLAASESSYINWT